MESSVQQTVSAPENQEKGFFAKALKAAAYPVSGLIGYGIFVRDLHHAVLDKLKKVGSNDPHGGDPEINNAVFGDIRSKYRPRYRANLDKSLTGKQMLQTETQTMHEHSQDMGKKMMELGFTERNEFLDFKGVRDKWRYINSSVHHKILLEGIAVTGIALGVLLTMVDNKWLNDRLGGKDKNENSRG